MRMRTIKIQIFYGKALSAKLRHRVKTGVRLRDGILHGVKTGRGFAMTQLHHAA